MEIEGGLVFLFFFFSLKPPKNEEALPKKNELLRSR